MACLTAAGLGSLHRHARRSALHYLGSTLRHRCCGAEPSRPLSSHCFEVIWYGSFRPGVPLDTCRLRLISPDVGRPTSAPGSQEPKVFFTGKSPLPAYLIALLSRDTLAANGIERVPHCQRAEVYTKLLAGTPFVPPDPRGAIQLDVEADLVVRRGSGAKGPLRKTLRLWFKSCLCW